MATAIQGSLFNFPENDDCYVLISSFLPSSLLHFPLVFHIQSTYLPSSLLLISHPLFSLSPPFSHETCCSYKLSSATDVGRPSSPIRMLFCSVTNYVIKFPSVLPI